MEEERSAPAVDQLTGRVDRGVMGRQKIIIQRVLAGEHGDDVGIFPDGIGAVNRAAILVEEFVDDAQIGMDIGAGRIEQVGDMGGFFAVGAEEGGGTGSGWRSGGRSGRSGERLLGRGGFKRARRSRSTQIQPGDESAQPQ